MSYIRYYAATHGVSSIPALAYLRSILRIADVRLITISGVLEGAWDAMSGLLVTPLEGPMIANVVCTDPDAWVRQLSIPMPQENPIVEVMRTSEVPEVAPGVERARGTIELYTAGTRNILIATSVPKSQLQCKAAAKYEAVIVPTPELGDKIAGAVGREPLVITVPVTDHMAMRAAIVT